MRNETIALHGGFACDPTTKAVAVPIYQTVAYEFDNADHASALFDLEVKGFRYSRISNPTTEVLERRVALLEDGVEKRAALSESTRCRCIDQILQRQGNERGDHQHEERGKPVG